MRSDPAEIERFLRWAFEPGDLFEVRGVDSSSGTLRGLFKGNFEQAARDAAEMADDYGAQVFYGLNPVDPSSEYARSTPRKTVARVKRALGSASVLSRRHLLLDLDPVRPKGTASTPEMIEFAQAAADAVGSHLAEVGWPEPLRGLSGNGSHLVYRLDGRAVESSAVKAALQYLAMAIDMPGIDFDTSVFDLPRPARLFGTLNSKVPGDLRESRVLSYPAETVAVPVARILELAALRGYVAAGDRPVGSDDLEPGLTEDDVLALIREYPRDLVLGSAERRSDGDCYFQLKKCPVVLRSHAGGNSRSVALRLRGGRLHFSCFAGGCHETTFRQMMRIVAERRGRQPSNPMVLAAQAVPPADTTGWDVDEDDDSEAPPTTALPPSLRPLPAVEPCAAMRTKPRLYLDFETRSEIDIRECGATKYLAHASTEPLLLAYAYDDGPVHLIDLAAGAAVPVQVLADLASPDCQKIAWNAGFEIGVAYRFLGVDVDLRQWLDPAALSRYLTFPASLSDACRDLGVASEQAKDGGGRALIRLFSVPQKTPKKRIKAGEPVNYWAGEASHPERWIQFGEYCRQDVAAIRTALARLETYAPLPQQEHNIWRLCQVINSRGIPVDLPYVTRAGQILAVADAATRAEIKLLTGVANPNSGHQMQAWLTAQGVTMESLDEDHIADALGSGKLSEKVAAVLRFKQQLSGAGPKKLAAIEARVLDDARLYGELFYHAAHTGRWASRGVQIQNLSKPSKSIEPRVDEITEAIRAGLARAADLDVATAVTGTVRSSIRPGKGHRLVVCDFNAIENRVLGWLAECAPLLSIYERGLDPYKVFAEIVFNKKYEDVTKAERNICKPAVLAAGFGLGWRGIQKQARGYDVKMTDAEAKKHIAVFRATYAEVPVLWNDVFASVVRAMRGQKVVVCRCFRIDATDARFLRVELPSGRSLCYRGAKLRQEKGEDAPTLFYEETEGEKSTYGGKLVENVVQAIARDLLCDAMLVCEREGIYTIMHVHDEIVAEVEEDRAEATATKMEAIMSATPPWCAGLPLAAKAGALD